MDISPFPEELNQDFIEIIGAREHNLQGVDLNIPRNQFVVITGISGSGKSSLAFDTLYAEGQRRYLETFPLMQDNLLAKWNGLMWRKYPD